MNNLILLNPIAGGGKARALYEELLANPPLAESLTQEKKLKPPREWILIETSMNDSWKKEVLERLNIGQIWGCCVIGGDGTVSQAAQQICEWKRKNTDREDLVLVPIPAGRGNDFVKALYGYEQKEEGGELVSFWKWFRDQSGFKSSYIDVGMSNEKFFLNMASIGYGGRVVESVHEKKGLATRIFGKSSLIYQIEGAVELFRSPEAKVHIEDAEKNIYYKGPFFGAFVGNGVANGDGLYWTADAKLTDGNLDALVFPRPDPLTMTLSLSAVKKKEKPTFNHQYFKFKECTMFFDQEVAIELDGEFVGRELQITMKCLPQALKVLKRKK